MRELVPLASVQPRTTRCFKNTSLEPIAHLSMDQWNARVYSLFWLRSQSESAFGFVVGDDDMRYLLLLEGERGVSVKEEGPWQRRSLSTNTHGVFRSRESRRSEQRRCRWIWTSWDIKWWSTSLFWPRAARRIRRSSFCRRRTGSSR